jgi:tetratricopeptide (TPR) repeat protein
MEFFGSRYKIMRTLGSGGMGVVYLVEDSRQGGKPVALKTLRAVGDLQAVEDFRSEFRNLRGVVHPHIPQMYDFGLGTVDGAPVHYFTSEYVEGQPLDRLRASWNSDALCAILVSLARALAFLHSRSLLHCDLKPENVLASLHDDGEFATLKLVDFGLAARITEAVSSGAAGESNLASAVGGTLDYLAPELLQGRKPTVQTDLYALGMMMYRLATGRLPFEHADPLALVQTRISTEVTPPLRLRPELPVGLSDVISAMLRLRPDERPASARHVIALLNERAGTEFAYETPETRTAYIRSAASVTNQAARERLALLRAKLDVTTPRPIVVQAPRGLGRTRLLRDFAIELQLDGFSVRLVETDADLDATDPVRVLVIPRADLVTRQWLHRVLEFATSAGVWCIIGHTELDAELETMLGPCETLTLAPMTRAEAAEMVQATFPDNTFSGEFSAELFDWAMGLPSAMQGIFDQLMEVGALRIGLNGWELLPGARTYALQESVLEFLEQRLRQLDTFSRSLLDGLACADGSLPLGGLPILQGLFDEIMQNVGDVYRELEAAGWVTISEAELSLSTSAIGEFLQQRISADDRKIWHERLRASWSSPALAEQGGRARALLYHDVHGGVWQTEPAEAEQLIREALAAGQSGWAKKLVSTALAGGSPARLRPLLLDMSARIAFLEGDLEGSARALGELLDEGRVGATPANLEQLARYAMLEEKLGRAGHAEEILLSCRAVLPEGPSAWASSVFGTLAWITFKRGESEAAATLAETGLVRVLPERVDAGYALLLNTVATLAFYRGDMDAAGLAWQRCLEVNETLRDHKGIANMYNNLGVLAAQSGERLRARTLWHKCAEIAREINDVHRLAGIYNNLGIDALETGALANAEDYYLKSLALFRRMRAPREQVATLSNLGELAYHRADFTRAQAYWQEAVQLAAATDDKESQIEPLIYWGKLLGYLDHHERSREILNRALEISRETGVKKGEAQAHEGLAQLDVRAGNAAAALRALQEANRLLTEDVDPLALLHLHLTECAVAAECDNVAGVKHALEKARKVGDIKWDPFTSARTLVYGLLFAGETLDSRERLRTIRQLTPYPDFLWKYYWATGRQLAREGSAKKALDEYGRAVAVLKALSLRMIDDHRDGFLASKLVTQFKHEATELRKLIGAYTNR